jgi:hypothetical protein
MVCGKRTFCEENNGGDAVSRSEASNAEEGKTTDDADEEEGKFIFIFPFFFPQRSSVVSLLFVKVSYGE